MPRHFALSLRQAGTRCSSSGCLARPLRSIPEQRRYNECRPRTVQPGRAFAAAASFRFPSSCAPSSASRQVADDHGRRTGGAGALPSPLSEHARRILRHVADSVAVCTAHTQHAAPGSAAVPVGLTMSSFAPLSLSPTPVITFNIAVPSRTEQVIAKTRHFMIHILSGDARGASLADVFRAGNAHPASTLRALQRTSCEIVWPGETPGRHRDEEQPYLQGSGVLCVLRCRLLKEPLAGLVPVRDHVVVLGEVLEIIDGGAALADSAGAPCFGLLYGDRHYRRLSRHIVVGAGAAEKT